MKNIEDDYIYEADLEDIIPASKSNICMWLLLTITIFFIGLLTLSCFIPYPKVLKGTAQFNDDRKTVVIFLSSEGTGEIRKGQEVHFYTTNYPEYNYGYLQGEVIKFVNNGTPNEIGLYGVLVRLEKSWTTNYGFILPNNLQLQGNGEIIVKKQQLIELFIGPISRILNKN